MTNLTNPINEAAAAIVTTPAAQEDHPSLWYHATSEDAEVWHGSHATREEAIDAGRGESDSDFWVCEALNKPLRLAEWLGIEDLLERAEEIFSDSDRATENDDTVFDATQEQIADFEARIRAACDEWQAAHNLKFTCWSFDWMGKPERIEHDRSAE